MRTLRPSSEDEMVATFLRSELGSERFATGIHEALRSRDAGTELVAFPDLDDEAANGLRRDVLGESEGTSAARGSSAVFHPICAGSGSP